MTQPHNITLKPEALLEHAKWAHALARSLVGEHAADDLVQETWVAALRARPKPLGSLRPWLGTVLGNFARQGWRRAERDRKGDQRFAAEETWPSAADLTERTESQRMLMGELLKLPEALREVLLLKYFEELSAVEIGRRQSVPASTIKSRIERGLELLREGLNEEFDGGRQAWGLALLPLFRGQPKGAVLSVTSRFSWALLLKRMLWPLAGTVGAAVLFVIGMNFFEALPIQEHISVEQVRFEPAVAQASPGNADARRSQRIAVEPLEQTPLAQTLSPKAAFETTLRVRFFDDEGGPVAGVQLFIKRRKELKLPCSDSMGRIEFVLPHSEAVQEYTMRYGHYELASDSLSFQTASGSVVDLGDVITTPGGALRGRVMDGLGAPLNNARVNVSGAPKVRRSVSGMSSSSPTRLGAGEAITDANGEFRLTGLLEGDIRVDVSARNELHAGRSGWVEIRAGQESSGLVIVAPAVPAMRRIEGRVFDPEGNPTRAGISARYRGLLSSGSLGRSTDREGFLRLILKQSVDHDLVISAPAGKDWAPILLPDVAPGSLDLRLHFKCSPSFQILATDPRGTALKQYSCTVLDRSEENELERILLGPVAASGLRVRLPEGGFVIRVQAPGFAPTDFSLGAGQIMAGEGFPVMLQRLPGVLGRVLHRGQPLPGARVFLQRRATAQAIFNGFPVRFESRELQMATCGPDGSFVLHPEASGQYIIRAVADGFAPREQGLTQIFVDRGIQGIVIDLSPGGSIRGHVVCEPGRNPARTSVAISRGDCWEQAQTVGVEGAFHFQSLTPGPWMVKVVDEVYGDDYSSVSFASLGPRGSAYNEIPFNCQVSEGRETRIDLFISERPSCQLTGRFALEGQDMSSWRGSLVSSGNADVQRSAPQDSFPLDTEGNFEMSVLGAGDWRLILKQQGTGGLRFSTEVQLSAGANRWQYQQPVAEVRWRGTSSWPAYYLWNGDDGLVAALPLPVVENVDEIWRLLPAGQARLVRYDASSTSVVADCDPSLPSTWPSWREFELKSGERRELVLGN